MPVLVRRVKDPFGVVNWVLDREGDALGTLAEVLVEGRVLELPFLLAVGEEREEVEEERWFE